MTHPSTAPATLVRPAQPRTTAQVKFADGRSYEAPVWTELEQYVRAAEIDKSWPSPIVAAMIDDELRELTYHIERDVEVTPLEIDDRDRSRIYRRSLTLLLRRRRFGAPPGSSIAGGSLGDLRRLLLRGRRPAVVQHRGAGANRGTHARDRG